MTHDYCRLEYKTTMARVRPVTTTAQRKESWSHVSGTIGPSLVGEFHGPEDFYWEGGADCKWDAKSQGWEAWLETQRL